MSRGDYHGFSHVYASRAGTKTKQAYDEFDYSAMQEAKKDELLRAVKRPTLTIQAGYRSKPRKASAPGRQKQRMLVTFKKQEGST